MIVVKGKSRLTTAQSNTKIISAELQLNKYTINFKMLSKTRLPSSTAATIVEKSSFDNVMSAACFVISVPLNPIATPTSAAFIAGASIYLKKNYHHHAYLSE